MASSNARANSRLQQDGASPNDAEFIPQPLIYVVRGRPGPDDRPALPSGHPEGWGAITRGTVLDQAVYPFPIFMDLPQ